VADANANHVLEFDEGWQKILLGLGCSEEMVIRVHFYLLENGTKWFQPPFLFAKVKNANNEMDSCIYFTFFWQQKQLVLSKDVGTALIEFFSG
jgi:hypothetical protein